MIGKGRLIAVPQNENSKRNPLSLLPDCSPVVGQFSSGQSAYTSYWFGELSVVVAPFFIREKRDGTRYKKSYIF